MTEYEHHEAVDDYLTYFWRETRSTIIIRFLNRSDRLLELVHHRNEFNEEPIKREIEHIIDGALGSCWENHTMWQAAQDVCPDQDKLVQEIHKDRAVRGLNEYADADERVDPKQALGQILKIHLNACRKTVVRLSEHRSRIWTLLLQHSREVEKEYHAKRGPPPPGHRCSQEHFKEIQERIRREDPGHRRVGRIRVNKIGEYFFEFCDECRKLRDRKYYDDVEPWSPRANELPPYLREEVWSLTMECLACLDKPLREVIYAAFPDLKDAVHSQDGIPRGDPKAFNKRDLKEALRRLRIGVELRLSERNR